VSAAVAFQELDKLSPNRDMKPPHERLGVLFHHSALSFDETVALMLRKESKVSYHCLIGVNGIRCRLVPDDQVAWHAGGSFFKGRTRCNDFLLGVAFAGDTYESPLSSEQIRSAIEWIERRWAPRKWTMDWMVDHRQVSPGRKIDLNPVEWERLRAAIEKRFGKPGPIEPPSKSPVTQ
jgi:AmpD protein